MTPKAAALFLGISMAATVASALFSLMEPEHLGVVHFIDVVAGQHEHMVRRVFLDHIDVLIDGVGRSLVPFVADPLLGRHGDDVFVQFSGEEVPGEPQVLVQGQGFVLGQHGDLADAGVDAVRQGEVDDPVDAAEGDRGLCPMDGEGMEPFSFAAGKDHSQYIHMQGFSCAICCNY